MNEKQLTTLVGKMADSSYICIIGVETDKVRGLDLDSFSGRYLTDRPAQLSFAAYHSSLSVFFQNSSPFSMMLKRQPGRGGCLFTAHGGVSSRAKYVYVAMFSSYRY